MDVATPRQSLSMDELSVHSSCHCQPKQAHSVCVCVSGTLAAHRHPINSRTMAMGSRL